MCPAKISYINNSSENQKRYLNETSQKRHQSRLSTFSRDLLAPCLSAGSSMMHSIFMLKNISNTQLTHHHLKHSSSKTQHIYTHTKTHNNGRHIDLCAQKVRESFKGIGHLSVITMNHLIGAFEQYAGLSRTPGTGLDSSKYRKLCKVTIARHNEMR